LIAVLAGLLIYQYVYLESDRYRLNAESEEQDKNPHQYISLIAENPCEENSFIEREKAKPEPHRRSDLSLAAASCRGY
jgi:hypothetical protein